MPTYSVYYATRLLFFSNSKELVIKDSSEIVVYSTKHEQPFITRATKHLYRGSIDSGEHIATIKNPSNVKFDIGGEVVINRPGWFSQSRTFEYDGSTYKWESFSTVTDDVGRTIAKYDRPRFGWGKAGELTVTDMSRDKLEVIMATFVARHWGWQITQRQNDVYRSGVMN